MPEKLTRHATSLELYNIKTELITCVMLYAKASTSSLTLETAGDMERVMRQGQDAYEKDPVMYRTVNMMMDAVKRNLNLAIEN